MIAEKVVPITVADGSTVEFVVKVYTHNQVSVAGTNLERSAWFDGWWDGKAIRPNNDQNDRLADMAAFVGAGFDEALRTWGETVHDLRMEAEARGTSLY